MAKLFREISSAVLRMLLDLFRARVVGESANDCRLTLLNDYKLISESTDITTDDFLNILCYSDTTHLYKFFHVSKFIYPSPTKISNIVQLYIVGISKFSRNFLAKASFVTIPSVGLNA